MGRDRRSQVFAWVRCTAVVLGCWWLLATTASGVWADARGAVSFDALLVALAAALAWLIAASLTCGLLATLVIAMASTLPGAVGGYARGLLAHMPSGSRRIAGAVLGITLTGVPLAAAASAAPVPRDPSPAVIRSMDGLPQLDRVAVVGGRAQAQVAASPSLASGIPGAHMGDLTTPETSSEAQQTPPASSADAAVQIGALQSGPSSTDQPATLPGFAAVTVRPGDSLWSLAARDLGSEATADTIAARWPQWYEANRDVIGGDPGLIHPGQLLHAPDHSAVATP